PPPRVRALISPSFPKVRCCMGSSLNQTKVRGEGADTYCLSGRWSMREGVPKVLICYSSKRAAGRQGRAGPHCSRTVLRAGCLQKCATEPVCSHTVARPQKDPQVHTLW